MVRRNAPSLALVRQGFLYRYQGDSSRAWKTLPAAGVSAPIPNFIAERDLGRLLIADARVKAARGDIAGAMNASLDAQRLGQDLDHGDHALVGAVVGQLIANLGSAEALKYVDRLNAAQARAALRRVERLEVDRLTVPEMLKAAKIRRALRAGHL